MCDTITFRFALGAKVRFRPMHRLEQPPCPWDPQPWRITTRAWHEMDGLPPVEQYTLMAWREGQGDGAGGYRTQGGVFPEQLEIWKE